MEGRAVGADALTSDVCQPAKSVVFQRGMNA